MRTHQQIDARSLALAQAVAAKIDADPDRSGVDRARANCARWLRRRDDTAVREWLRRLEQPWDLLRPLLLEDSERGRRLRQSNPFCGVLSHSERWCIYRAWSDHETRRP